MTTIHILTCVGRCARESIASIFAYVAKHPYHRQRQQPNQQQQANKKRAETQISKMLTMSSMPYTILWNSNLFGAYTDISKLLRWLDGLP